MIGKKITLYSEQVRPSNFPKSEADPGICEGGGPSLYLTFFSPFLLFLVSPSPLEAGLLKPAKGSGERCKPPPIGVRGRAPAENEFGALQKATGRNHFEYSEYHVLQ